MRSSKTSGSEVSGVSVLAVTAGEPAGIGPDITLSAWVRREALALPVCAVFGDPETLRARARVLGLDVPVCEISQAGDAAWVFGRALPVVEVSQSIPTVAGKPDPANGAAVIAAIELATAAVANGEASALVTNPIAKSVLYKSGFRHPGHTEFLAELAARHFPGPRLLARS